MWLSYLARISNIGAPWNINTYYTSIRGAENFHVYLWIAKDLCWSNDWVAPALVFGSLAEIWCLMLLYLSIMNKSLEETYQTIGVVLWLTSNFVWMYGEVVNNDDDILAVDSNHIFMAAFAWYGLYHLVLHPFGFIKADPEVKKKYDRLGLKPRFEYFENWRQYEHIHTVFWLGKDYSWNSADQISWIIFFVPTLVVALDLIWLTWNAKGMMVDCIHYVAVLLWVLGNMTWAIGDVFYPAIDGEPHSMWESNVHNRSLFRWWCCWVLISAYIPIILLYGVWLPLTYYEMIPVPALAQESAIAVDNLELVENASYAADDADLVDSINEAREDNPAGDNETPL